MLIDCPSCGHSVSDATLICPRCAREISGLSPSMDRDAPGSSPSTETAASRTATPEAQPMSRWEIVWRAILTVGFSAVGMPVPWEDRRPLPRPQGKWFAAMIAGKVVAVGGCLWMVVAIYLDLYSHFVPAILAAVAGLTLAILSRMTARERG